MLRNDPWTDDQNIDAAGKGGQSGDPLIDALKDLFDGKK